MLRVASLSLVSLLALAPAAFAGKQSFQFSLPAGRVHVDTHQGAVAVVVNDPAFVTLSDPGQPALPYRVANILLPQGQEVTSFRATVAGERAIAKRAALAQSVPALSEDGKAGRTTPFATVAAGVYPGERARLLSTGTLHGYTIATFAIFPIRADGDDVVVADDVTLEIETGPSSRPAPVLLERASPQVREHARGQLARTVVNPRDASGYVFNERIVPKRDGGFAPAPFPSLEGSPVEYVIVTNDSLAAAFQVLADFKTAKGVPTVVRTTEWIAAHYRNGSDIQETIRNFAIDAYAKWGITYLMLGGDTKELPPRFAWSGFYDGGHFLPTDMYFGCLDGDWNADNDDVFGEEAPSGVDFPDLYAEVYVGRVPSASVAEANLMVGKIITYETPTVPAFGNSVLMLGEVLFPMGWAPPQAVTLNGADLLQPIYNNYMTGPGFSVTRMYETEELFPGSIDENRTAVISQLNTGFNHVIHVGHGYRFNMSVGDVSLVNADADALTNGNELSCLYFLNCTGASYTYSCIAEHFLRNPNGGAASVIGANDSAFPNASTFYMNEYYKLMFQAGFVHSGQAFADSRLPRTGLASSGDFIDLWTHYIYTLLGDPEMPMWTGPVTTLSLAHTSSVAVGTNSITVTVTDGGNPVDSATVCLSKGEEDYEVGTTDGAGQVTFSFRAETAGSITVVATGRNHARKTGSIAVTNSAAYVKIDAISVDDDNAGGTSGNGNGLIEGGEVIDLGFTLRNSGTATTGTVSVILRSNHAAISVTDSTASGGTISPGGTGAMTGGCRVVVHSWPADEFANPFVLIINNNGTGTWRDEFKRAVHQPVIDLVKVRIDDTAFGNGNGFVNTGEQFKLFYKIKNFGTGSFPGGTVTVSDLDNGFTFIDSVDTYGAIAPMASAENSTGLEMIEPNVVTAHRLEVAIVDLLGRAYADTVELRQPIAPTLLVIDPGLGPDRLRVSWAASVSGDAVRYNLYRALASGGPYTLANPDPVGNTFYVNTGLNPNTLYYFRSTAVDTSGNESGFSTTFSGSTNPPQLSGWPIALKVETASSPAVGDIDGDGSLEIVSCADKVYAWHANGNEMLDGDNDAQTWGVLSTQGSQFVSHPALARMDLAPGLEILCASRDQKLVYIFKGNGTVMTGWPRPVENEIRAGVVAGDINADGKFEVIAVDERGVVYVWKADGTEFRDGDSNPSTQGVFYRTAGVFTFNYSTPAVADMDADGREEIIVGTQGNQLYVFNDDGTIAPNFPYALTSAIAGSPSIGDVDANGDLEIVLSEFNGNFRVLNHDATQQVFQFFQNGLFFGPSPAIANVSGDAKLEMFIAAKNSRLYGINSIGNFLPGFPVFYNTSNGYTESSPVIGDLDGDGILDIVIGDESHFIRGFNALAQPLPGFPLLTDDAMRSVPSIADLDSDGSVDLVATGWDKNVYVWDFNGTWNPNNAPWPRFHGNLHNNGRLNFVVPTPVLGAGFFFTLGDERVDLEWNVPAEAGRLFDVQRAELSGEVTGAFHRIAKGVGATVDGRVKLTDKNVEMGSRYVYRLSNQTGLVHETQGVYMPVTRAALGQNFPNPFNPVTKIEYWVPDGVRGGRATVNVVVYDVRGARVKTLVSGPKSSGRYVAEWDGHDDAGSPVSSGVYFYRMTTGSFADVRKMVLLK